MIKKKQCMNKKMLIEPIDLNKRDMETLNKHVLKFLKRQYSSPEMSDKWMRQDTQARVQDTLNGVLLKCIKYRTVDDNTADAFVTLFRWFFNKESVFASWHAYSESFYKLLKNMVHLQ